MELDFETAARAFGSEYFDLIRRGADGSLVLSADRWRLAAFTGQVYRFVGADPEAPTLELRAADVERVTWDQLPKQRTRSQVRFLLRGGDLWSFSGRTDSAALGR